MTSAPLPNNRKLSRSDHSLRWSRLCGSNYGRYLITFRLANCICSLLTTFLPSFLPSFTNPLFYKTPLLQSPSRLTRPNSLHPNPIQSNPNGRTPRRASSAHNGPRRLRPLQRHRRPTTSTGSGSSTRTRTSSCSSACYCHCHCSCSRFSTSAGPRRPRARARGAQPRRAKSGKTCPEAEDLRSNVVDIGIRI